MVHPGTTTRLNIDNLPDLKYRQVISVSILATNRLTTNYEKYI